MNLFWRTVIRPQAILLYVSRLPRLDDIEARNPDRAGITGRENQAIGEGDGHMDCHTGQNGAQPAAWWRRFCKPHPMARLIN